MCKYCSPENVSYDDYSTDCNDGKPLPLFKHPVIVETDAPYQNDDVFNCVVGIIDNVLVMRMPSAIGWSRSEPAIMGKSTINYCPMCGRKLN